MTTLWLDLETRSRVNLPLVGVHKYARECEITICSWAINDNPVNVDEGLTEPFLNTFNRVDRIIAHNAEFDRTVLSHFVDDVRFDYWYCTMSQARRHGLPGGLDKLCDILKVPADKAKLKEAHKDLMLFCKPLADGTWADKATHPNRWARFMKYGGLDVEAMREVHRRCPKWNDETEQAVWLVDQKINARGFAVDVDFAEKAVALLTTEGARLDKATREATDGAVDSARQRDALLVHILGEYGVDLPDMKAATLERRLKDTDLPDAVRNLLDLRMQSSRSSTSKYKTLLRCVEPDGRMRGGLTYSGAMRTKRWAGNRFQCHNMMRPEIGGLRGTALKDEVRFGISAVKAGVYDLVGRYPLTTVLASSTRGCIVPEKGKLLVIADWSNIEGRKLAWLAGELGKLAAFRAFDAGEGPDLYRLAFSRAFGIPVDQVDDFMRQIGKVMELMLGFGGGVGAFVTGAATYKISLEPLVKTAWPAMPDDIKEETAGMWRWSVDKKRTLGLPEMVFRTCDGLKRLWRRQHPRTESWWGNSYDEGDGLENWVRRAILTGKGEQHGRIAIDMKGAWLRIELPSGGYLSYPGAQVKPDGSIRYLGQNQYTRQWGWVGTYGGKIAENIDQASCRDDLAWVLCEADRAQVPIVMHVHDEPIAEVPKDDADDVLAWLVETMENIPASRHGMPVAVAGHVTDRYHKE